MRYFCTYFDSNFLYRGLALYRSLCKHAGDFKIWVLCLDDAAYDLLSKLNYSQIEIIHIKKFEEDHSELNSAKSDRSLIEYYWTITPILMSHVLNKNSYINKLTYLDADLFFYSDVKPIYDEWSNGSIYVVPHRFSPERKEWWENYAGRFNVGLVGISNDDTGLSCLKRWSEQCLESCVWSKAPTGVLGDQKYLDEWPKLYSNLVESQNIGVGAGGWNILNYKVGTFGKKVFLNDAPLIMLHLNFVTLNSNKYFSSTPRWSLRSIYKPYATELKKVINNINEKYPDFKPQYEKISLFKFVDYAIRGGVVPII